MDTHDFSIQDVLPRASNVDFVILQAGKGKAKFSSIYINSYGFSYLEGLIWDKFREFGRKKKAKISSDEWNRIIKGFQVALEKLRQKETTESLEEILKFEIVHPSFPISKLKDSLEDFEYMMKEVIDWLSNQINEEKYIYVVKNHM